MGNLLIYSKSFTNINEDNVNELLVDFIDSFNTAIHYQDKIFQENLLKNFEFEFGNFFNDLIYGTYENIITIPPLENLKQIIHQDLQQLFYAIPSGGEIVGDMELFLKNKENLHIGLIGLFEIKHQCPNNLKVYNIPSWINWRTVYYSKNNNRVVWKNHEFLPNIDVSNFLLSAEVSPNVDIKQSKTNQKWSKNYCDDFNQKGYSRGEMLSKAEIIGDKIAQSNYYLYQKRLSLNESKRTQSKRKIYKIEREGKDIYLSIDFHKCFCFEICNHKGEHLGEIRFDGLLNGKNSQDKTGRHDIKIK